MPNTKRLSPLPFSIILDFDSTIIQAETLDELAKIALAKSPNRKEVLERIATLTEAAMNGSMSIEETLTERLKLLKANKTHINRLILHLKEKVSPSIKRNAEFFKKHNANIYVFSSGFKEVIVPIVRGLGLRPDKIYANSFLFDPKGNITGLDSSCLLAKERGKILQLLELNLRGPVYVIGDGYTDLQMRESGKVERFYAFTENVSRQIVVDNADYVLRSFDEFLYQHKLPMKHSYPRSKIVVLLLEGVHSEGVKMFQEAGFTVHTERKALSESELTNRIKEVSLLGVRSKTTVTKEVLRNAKRLIGIGAFCIGTEQIDTNACLDYGVCVFNAPYSNTRSVVELALGEIIVLLRRIVDSSTKLHAGSWEKTALGCYEVRGKELGIVGYGNIGSQLSVLAEALGMRVCYYDIVEKLSLGNAYKCRTLDELLRRADIVTVHVDGRPSNRMMFGAREFELLREGAIFLNLSRGSVVDLEALAVALRSKKLAGVAIDVYPDEPAANGDPFHTPLAGLPNVILTPHIGGSTIEAQRGIAEYVAERMIDYVNNGSSQGSVNFPQIQLPPLQRAHRMLHIHRNVPGVLARLNSLFASHKINILGQHLKTNDKIGYVITDVDKEYDSSVVSKLKLLPDTLRFRVLY